MKLGLGSTDRGLCSHFSPKYLIQSQGKWWVKVAVQGWFNLKSEP